MSDSRWKLNHTWAPIVQKTEKVYGWEGQPPSRISLHEKLQLKRALQNVSIYGHGMSSTIVVLLGGYKKTDGREKKINDRNIPIAQ